MKKMTCFLMGAGTAIAGLAAYVFFKELEDNYEVNEVDLEKKYDVAPDAEADDGHLINVDGECAEYRDEPGDEADESGSVSAETDESVTQPDEGAVALSNGPFCMQKTDKKQQRPAITMDYKLLL